MFDDTMLLTSMLLNEVCVYPLLSFRGPPWYSLAACVIAATRQLLRGATAAARLYHPSETLSQANHLLCVRLRSASPPGRRQALAPHTPCLASERSFRAQALLALCGVLLFDGLAAHVVEVPRGASSEQTHSYPLGSASSASW